MTTNSVQRAAQDIDLQRRVQAVVYDQAFNNPDVEDSEYAASVRQGFANFTPMYWMVANAVQAEYEAGLVNGRGSPGFDLDVISDGAILAAVQANWPPDSMQIPTPPVIP